MKKIAVAALIALSVSSVWAKDTKLFPILSDGDYCLGPAVALVGGYGKTNNVKSSGLYGVEFSLACPLLQLSDFDIKQQVSLVHQNNDGYEATSFELNPHVMFDVANKVQVGVGPELGVLFAKGTKSDTVFTYGLGASANYDLANNMFVGAEARYQWTTDAELGGTKDDLNNFRTLLKVGVHF